MTFGRSPHDRSSPYGPGPAFAPDRRLDAPYADGVPDGFGGRAPAADGVVRPPDGFGGGASPSADGLQAGQGPGAAAAAPTAATSPYARTSSGPDTHTPVWPLASPHQSTPANHGQALVGDLQAVRIQNPGKVGEFRDPVATTLYPTDLLEIRVSLPPADAATAFGRIDDSAGLLAMRRVEYRGNAVVLIAEAVGVGRTFTTLSIMSDGAELARFPYTDLTVVKSLADVDNQENGSQRVKTTDIESALGQIRVAIDSLFAAQKDGVSFAQTKLLQHPSRPRLPWYAELFALGGEALVSALTAGVGSRFGRALAQWSVGTRDLDLGRVPLFDFESAFSGGLKDSMKQYARSQLFSSGTAEGMTVDEQWAIALFCAAQVSALDKVRLDLQGEFNNSAKAYKDLEAAQPGLGLSAVEAHRHALAETSQPLTEESEQLTVREWLKSLALTTHGTFGGEPAAEPTGTGVEPDGAPSALGSNMARAGRGHLTIRVTPGDPAAPPSLASMWVAGVDGPGPSVLTGTVGELGLPIEVHLGTMVIRRNETAQVWIETLGTMAVLGGNLSWPDQKYLFIKGTGRTAWETDEELQAGVDAGADKLLAEVAASPVRL